jgi:hypothetical protein
MGAKPVPNDQLVAFARVLAEHDGVTEHAAAAFGISETASRRWVKMIKDKGLTGAELSVEAKLRIQNAQLQRDVRALQREADSAERIRTEIFNLATYTPDPPKWLTPGKPPLGHRGTPVALWSDWHYGEVVRPEEVGGVNVFDSDVARARVDQLVNTTIDLCYNHMGRAEAKYPGIVVCLGGDMMTGEIHEELLATNDRTNHQQVNELTDILIAALTELADKFGNIFVPCVPGNHGRSTRKPRMKGRVFTSYEWLVYCALERYFRGDKRLQFFIPSDGDAYFKVYGHRFLLTHGDTLGVKGGDGIIGAIGPIMRGSIKVGRSEAEIGRNIDTILMGHWHQMLWLPGAIVNGALKGYDEYARLALRAPYSRPSQALFFVHPEHGITAKWEVYLDKGRTVADAGEWIGWRTEP